MYIPIIPFTGLFQQFWFCEDHSARRGLQYAGNEHFHHRADVLATALHDDHRAVIQIRDALTMLLAVLDNLYQYFFPGRTTGLTALARSLMFRTDTPRLTNLI